MLRWLSRINGSNVTNTFSTIIGKGLTVNLKKNPYNSLALLILFSMSGYANSNTISSVNGFYGEGFGGGGSINQRSATSAEQTKWHSGWRTLDGAIDVEMNIDNVQPVYIDISTINTPQSGEFLFNVQVDNSTSEPWDSFFVDVGTWNNNVFQAAPYGDPVGYSSHTGTTDFSIASLASDGFSWRGGQMSPGGSSLFRFVLGLYGTEDYSFSLRFTPNGVPSTMEAPIPAALFMFAPALLGFMGFRRRAKNLAA